MSNQIRRGGGKIVKLLESTGDPTPAAGEATIYAKDSAGTTKIFMRDGAGTISEVGAGGGASSIVIVREGDATNVNLSTLGTIDWFAQLTVQNTPRTLTSSRLAKVGSEIISNWVGNTAGQGTSTTLMSATTRSSTASDSTEGANINTTGSWGVSTPNASTAYAISFRVPSGNNPRVLRVYCGNAFMVARLTCTLSDGTTQFIESDNNGAFQTHEYKITYSGYGSMIAHWHVVSVYGGTKQFAFAACSLGLV